MLPLIADEDFNGRIVRGLLRRVPQLDIVRVQDIGLRGGSDPDLLEWAAIEGRVLVTHDVNTMTRHAYDRLTAGERMSGVVVVSQDLPIGAVIEDLSIIVLCSAIEQWPGQIVFLPL